MTSGQATIYLLLVVDEADGDPTVLALFTELETLFLCFELLVDLLFEEAGDWYSFSL